MTMPRTRALLLGVFLSFPLAHAQPSDCDSWFDEPQVHQLVGALHAIADAGPTWDTYTIANHPVALAGIVEGSETGGCALIWRVGEAPERLTLAEPAPFPVQLYGFWNGDSLGANPHPLWSQFSATMQRTALEIEAAIRARGEARTIVLRAPLRTAELGPLGEMLEQMDMNPVDILARLAVHESYHLHSQFPTWFDQEAMYAWPSWLAMSDRNTMVQTCYQGTEDVIAARDAEMQQLLATWDQLYPTKTRDVDTARAEAQRYVEARQARYALLDTATVMTSDGPMSCADAEAVWELTEGSAQWVGDRSAFEAGISSIEIVRGSFNGNANAPFYASGSFQLWILNALLGRTQFLEMTHAITRSETPDGGIFGSFMRHTAP
ncbi:MAG: hypothetical protein Rubg2KO_26540 [Rubricoccaceae bacterium]